MEDNQNNIAKDEIITLEVLIKKISESNEVEFNMTLLFNSYFKREKDLLVNNLITSERRDEDIGTINYIGFLVNKINQIQEKRNER